MFDRLKKVFGTSEKPAAQATSTAPLSSTDNAAAEWARSQGLSYASSSDGKGFVMTGRLLGKPWKLERGRSSRNYIHGEELRARAELEISEDVSVLVMNRALKESLEKRAYQMYTDTLQTTADPNLPEEMRWLAMYEEVGWDALSPAFWERYSVLADDRGHAEVLIDVNLAALMMSWPEPAPDAQVPFILMLMRGKSYLRMQYSPTDQATLAHAAMIFTTASESAVDGLSTDISL
ncbi:MAG: hypothetical protein V4772_00445 [Pseudomonadota bacterium]